MEIIIPEEEIKLKTLCEFLFLDLYQNWATYERFERCFQPLFNNIEINLYKAFIEIVGEKKKYITYPRFVNAYLKYKSIKENNKMIENNYDLYIFFDKTLNNILKGIDSYVGEHKDFTKDSKENVISFSTKRARLAKLNKLNESYVSQIQILVDIHQRILGINLEYDDINKFELCPKDIKKNLLKGLEINLDIINPEYYKAYKKSSNIDFNVSLYRDSITHIFGTIERTKNIITFLGFKCVSGKFMYIGIPEGESFLFGEFGKKFYNLRIEMKREEGITLFEPGFIENLRTNFYLKQKKIIEEDNIFEEEYLKNLEGDLLNQSITTTIINENEFKTQIIEEKVPGYDYKEVVNLSNRNWIKNKFKKKYKKKGIFQNIKSFNDVKTLYTTITQKSLSKSTYIFKEKDKTEAYSYNPSQNPLLKNNKLNKQKIEINPFFNLFAQQGNPDINGLILHKTVALFPKKNKQINYVYCNEIKENTKPKEFFKKLNFRDLKEQLTKEIYKEFDKIFKEFKNGSLIPFNILNEIVPYQIDEREEHIKKEIPQNQRALKLNGKEINFFDFNNKSIREDLKKNEDEKNKIKRGKILDSDAAFLWKKIYKNFVLFKTVNKKDPMKRWHTFRKRLEMKFARKLFTTIGKIIKAKNAIYKQDVSLEEKIQYYIFLADKANEKIINFLSINEDKDDNDWEDQLIPDKNPEYDNSLENLEKRIYEIQNLIKCYNKDKDGQLKYLKKIIDYLNQQKNILIENITEQEKDKLIQELTRKIIEKHSNTSNVDIELKLAHIFGLKRKRNGGLDMKKDEEEKKTIIFKQGKNNNKDKEIKENLTSFHGQEEIKENKDPKFSPEPTSLCPMKNNIWDLPSKVLNSDVEDWEKINWKQYKNIRIYSKNSLPNLDNIRQGEYIGDCYFLSALGSLCGDGCNSGNNYLMNLIGVKNDNHNIYFVKLNINGKWKKILIDNYFPIINNIDKDTYELCFGSSFQKELWVSLFEKAWAKINGCYASIGCGGFCGEAFDVLTDAYTESHQIIGINEERKKELWKILIDAKKSNCVICAGTRHFGMFENIIYSSGLISGHAYTIINVYENEKYKLVKLRNPWGEKEYNGDWSDNSDKWNEPGLKKLFEFDEAKDDGIFYMSYDHFLYFYQIVEILKINPDYKTLNSCKIKKTEAYKCQLIYFQITKVNKCEYQKGETTKVFINLYQKNPRIIRKNGTHFPNPVKSYIILAKKEKEKKKESDVEYTFIQSVTGTKVHITIEADLEIGELYLIFCDVNYRFVYDEIYGYNITFYSHSSNHIKIYNITNKINGKERAKILRDVLYDHYIFYKNDKDEVKAEKQNDKKGLLDFFWKKEEDKIEILRLNYYNEKFPFIILLLRYKEGIEIKDTDKIYFKLELNQTYKDKNMCIYNDPEASEFDMNMIKEVKHNNTIILIMGYTYSSVFNITTDIIYGNKENKITNINHHVFEKKHFLDQKNNLYEVYCIFAEKKKGYILGIKNISDKDYLLNISFEGLNDIDPEYDNINYIEEKEKKKEKNSNIIDIRKIKMLKGQIKIFNLRLKAGCENFGFDIKICEK